MTEAKPRDHESVSISKEHSALLRAQSEMWRRSMASTVELLIDRAQRQPELLMPLDFERPADSASAAQ